MEACLFLAAFGFPMVYIGISVWQLRQHYLASLPIRPPVQALLDQLRKHDEWSTDGYGWLDCSPVSVRTWGRWDFMALVNGSGFRGYLNARERRLVNAAIRELYAVYEKQEATGRQADLEANLRLMQEKWSRA